MTDTDVVESVTILFEKMADTPGLHGLGLEGRLLVLKAAVDLLEVLVEIHRAVRKEFTSGANHD